MHSNASSKLDHLTTNPASGVKEVIEMPKIKKSRLAELLEDAPPGKWVALSHDENSYLGAADSFGAAAKLAAVMGELAPVIVPNPKDGILPVVP